MRGPSPELAKKLRALAPAQPLQLTQLTGDMLEGVIGLALAEVAGSLEVLAEGAQDEAGTRLEAATAESAWATVRIAYSEMGQLLEILQGHGWTTMRPKHRATRRALQAWWERWGGNADEVLRSKPTSDRDSGLVQAIRDVIEVVTTLHMVMMEGTPEIVRKRAVEITEGS